MKTIKTLIGVAALLLATVSTQAQTNTGTFISTAESYFTSFNTNYSWTNITLEAGLGYKQVTGDPAASTLDAQFDLGRFNIGAAVQFDGVGSALNEGELQFGYAVFEHYDTKVDVDLRAGYSFENTSAVVEPLLTLKKKLTENTYAETGVSLPFFFSGANHFSRNPTFYVETGFTF